MNHLCLHPSVVHCTLSVFLLLANDANSFQSPKPLAYRQGAERISSKPAVTDDRSSVRSSTLSKRWTLSNTKADIDNVFDVDIDSSSLQLTNDTTTLVPPVNNTYGEVTAAEIKLYPDTPTFRECLAFTLPALGIYICSPLMSLIDASFIGRASSVELAALGPASSISDSAPLPLLFLSIASTNLIAKSYAENDQKSLARVSRTAIGMGSICGVVLAAMLYGMAGPISALYCSGPSAALLAPACTKYVSIRALALPAVVITTISQAVCIGTKDTKTPMISVALAGMLNLLGDFLLVKWLGQGIAGAAWATSLSQILSAGLLLRVLKKRGFLQQAKDENSNTMATVKQLLKFIPFLFVMAVKIGWHNSCSATAASLGGVRAAAHTAVISVTMICMVLGDVGSSLSQAFLPPFASKDKKSGNTSFDIDAAMPTIKQLLKCTLSISTTVMCLATLMIGVFGGQITCDPQVLVEMRRTLPWIVATLCFHGSAVTLEGVLLSSQKFRGLTVNYSILAVIVAAFQLATRRFNLGLTGVWGCYLCFCSSRVVTFLALGGLLRPRRWMKGRVTAEVQPVVKAKPPL